MVDETIFTEANTNPSDPRTQLDHYFLDNAIPIVFRAAHASVEKQYRESLMGALDAHGDVSPTTTEGADRASAKDAEVRSTDSRSPTQGIDPTLVDTLCAVGDAALMTLSICKGSILLEDPFNEGGKYDISSIIPVFHTSHSQQGSADSRNVPNTNDEARTRPSTKEYITQIAQVADQDPPLVQSVNEALYTLPTLFTLYAGDDDYYIAPDETLNNETSTHQWRSRPDNVGRSMGDPLFTPPTRERQGSSISFVSSLSPLSRRPSGALPSRTTTSASDQSLRRAHTTNY